AKLVARWYVGDDGAGVLSVEDNGAGIAPDLLEEVIKPFVQANGQTADPYIAKRGAGVGLGLHIVKRLAELHQAQLEIDSIVGEGTIVAIKFPEQRLSRG
ncbi:MAG: ATP-binding protein, partial [Rhodospirillaceae bacterium]